MTVAPTAIIAPTHQSEPVSHRQPRMLDMFAGAGGTGLGFVRAGFQIVGVVEWNSHAAATYSRNLGIPVSPQDIRDLNPKTYRESLNLEPGDLEVLVGCSPCQGFSNIRNDKGAGDDRNQLVLLYLSFIAEFQPRFVLFENVAGIRTRHGREIYQAFCVGLVELGYKVRDELLDAADHGIPQHRERVLVVAGRNGEVPPFPAPTHGAPDSPEVRNGLIHPWRTVRDAIAEFPAIAASQNGEQLDMVTGVSLFPNHVAPKTGAKVLEFLCKVPHDGGSRRQVARSAWLKCHLDLDSCNGFNDVYGRLAWDKPAGTLTTGCTNPSRGRFTHPEQDRAITAREAATLQSFPSDFVFEGKCHSTQIGNAVPPLLAQAIAETLYDRLKEQPVFLGQIAEQDSCIDGNPCTELLNTLDEPSSKECVAAEQVQFETFKTATELQHLLAEEKGPDDFVEENTPKRRRLPNSHLFQRKHPMHKLVGVITAVVVQILGFRV